MKRLVNTGIAMLFAGLVFGQSGDSTLQFEAADIHPAPAAAPGTNPQNMRGGLYRGGHYEIRSATMRDLVRAAYNVDADNVTGGPVWIDKDRFDLTAQAPGASTPEKVRVMLRNLLAQRFGLAVHNDTKPFPAYAITPGKKVRMKQSTGLDTPPGCELIPPSESPQGGPVTGIPMSGIANPAAPGALIAYQCHNVSIAELPDQLRNMTLATRALNGAPVVDRTGLKGGWDFNIKYSGLPQDRTDTSPEAVTIFAAFEKQLGLKLERIKVPMPVIAIDSVNENPAGDPAGVNAKLAVLPLKFEVAEIRPSDPNPPEGSSGGDCFYCPGGRLHISRFTMSDLIATAWNLNGNYDSRVIGLPKSLEKTNWDVIARVSTMTPVNPVIGQPPAQQVDFDSVRIMLQALLEDRFKLALHEETRQLNGYALVAVRPKLTPAGPDNRPGCKEGPGPDGKDPRTTNPLARRLLTCLNITVAEFVAELPNRAGDYFRQYPGKVVDATGLKGKYDFMVNFSPLGMVMNSEATDPGYAIPLPEALEKQLGLRLEPRKNPAMVLVVDHVEEKPVEN
ncbi:MAG TPA: TIGR03435 family protein [Bryobacteraceae bacterium]|nr:TIGR03435 family protein [Bryobacteraceae bacterium]